MEAFSLLNYWRNTNGGVARAAASGGGGPLPTLILHAAAAPPETTTIAAASVTHHDQDGGPFFDLEFSLPDEHGLNNNRQTRHHIIQEDHQHKIEEDEDEEEEEEEEECDSDESDGENEKDGELIEFALSSCSSGGGGGGNMTDPSDDLFFKGRLVSVDTTTTTNASSEQHHAAAKSQFLQKSATKFRVLMLKLKKSKCNADAAAADGSATTANQQQQPASKFLTVKFKVEDVPIMSLFFRDSSSSSSSKSQKQIAHREIPPSDSSSTDEKRFSKDLMQKYLNKVKPLYVRVSKRYADNNKPKFPEQQQQQQLTLVGSPKTQKPETTEVLSETVEETPVQQGNSKGQKQGNLQAGLRVVYKHLGKSRSASSAATPLDAVTSRRRDDSLLEQQDGIQGAILHCKRSFNASRDSASSSSSIFDRNVSFPAMAPEELEKLELEGFIFNQ
ncbi:probable membrane-associated kinase regulator 2 [Impatiens glandulifera]|uniref:probable membrane-associated kinase regulator 2 n=1 Tax=Impatiens glandulifera TaxID=253017 RepID=UPI001FB18651|nr:probable membrane-associated kinase regulator 2 [Impatiens glandulifera]